ncbi:hypothetical protein HA402_009266 [Bradysia odoriphaga]|nr:hypothetical protein HA402_009266 [Bradysia odoriphaga]
MKLFTEFVLIVALVRYASGYKILGLFPHPATSHFNMFQPILHELANKGHEVTVVSHFPHPNPPINYKDLTLPGETLTNAISLQSDWFLNRRYYGHFYEFWFVYQWGQESCRAAYNSTAIQKVLNSKSKYDVILMETFNTDCLMGVVWKLQAPVIALSSCNLMPWHYDRVGNPHLPSFVPSLFLEHSDIMTFKQRLLNFIDIHLKKAAYNWIVDGYTDQMLKEIFGNKIPSVAELKKETSLMFVNSHYSLSGVKPLSPAVIEIGGIHIKEPKPLNQDIKDLLDSSDEGVIFVSWGSMVKADTMTAEIREGMVRAFGTFKVKFLWKWENDTLPNKPENVYIEKWLQQREILCHPNVKAFITHGGLLGSSEAAHCGVPTIITPMYGDQFLNAAGMVRRGMGVVVHYEQITMESMQKAIKFALSPATQLNAKTVSLSFNNRITKPLHTAVWWVEHVAATKGARLLQSNSVYMDGFAYYLFDVYAVLGVGIATIVSSWIWVFYWFCCYPKSEHRKLKRQ